MISKLTTRMLTLGAIVAAGVMFASAPGVGPPGEGFGNNLSYPVIWAEGVTKPLRGTFGDMMLDGEWYYWWGTDASGNPLACLPDPDAAPGEAYCDDGFAGTVGPPPGPADVIYIAFSQQDQLNEWQAESADWSDRPVLVDWIDWGDNLESVPWYLNSMVRTEVVLFQDLGTGCAADLDGSGSVDFPDLTQLLVAWGPCPTEGACPADFDENGEVAFPDLTELLASWGDCLTTHAMMEYQMRHLKGWGQTEMWGVSTTDGVVPEVVTYDYETTFPQATVYSPCARLTIQKLLVPRDDPRLADLAWVPGTGWTEPDGSIDDLVNEPIYNMAVWEGGDGPGYYSAEINVKGRIIFGYTWNVRRLNQGASDYRITFSLDETCANVDLNTFFDEALIVEPAEEEESADDGGPGGGQAVIDYEKNLTFIDIQILSGH